jgi:hypothetical protein
MPRLVHAGEDRHALRLEEVGGALRDLVRDAAAETPRLGRDLTRASTDRSPS